MKIIVGLGNPGPKYLNTRHNIGFSIIDAFANQITIEKKERKAKCIMQFGDHNDTDIVLVKPRTFINNSGIAIKYLIDRYQIELSDLLVVYDDIALPVGKIRVRINGSSGGHNGIKSIIEATDGHIFPRLRIGVGSPHHTNVDLVNWVLGKFDETETVLMEKTISKCIEAISFWISNDIDTTMNAFN